MKDKTDEHTIVCNRYYMYENINNDNISNMLNVFNLNLMDDNKYHILNNSKMTIRIPKKDEINEMIVEIKGLSYSKTLVNFHLGINKA